MSEIITGAEALMRSLQMAGVKTLQRINNKH